MPDHRYRANLLTMLLLAFVLNASSASARDGEGVTWLGAGFTGRPFALGGDVVLETDGIWNSMRDYGDPALPGWLGWHHGGADGGRWREVLWDDGLAAVLRDEFNAGVQFVDFSDPAAPVTVGSIIGTSYAAGLLHGRLLCLARAGLIIVYDVTSPASPVFRFAGTLPFGATPHSFCATGDVIYLVESGATVRALDATNPLAIIDLGHIDLGTARIDALAAAPGALYALLATETAPAVHRLELVTFDVAGPTAPQETDRRVLVAGLGARGLQLRRRDDLLLAAENQAGTHAFDVSSPTLPVPGFVLPIVAEQLVITASRVLTFADEELRIHARTPAAETPPLLSTRHLLPDLRRLSGTGPVLLAQPEKDHSLLIPVDVADPANPRLGVEFETGLDGDYVHRGDTVVMIDGDDLQVVDLRDPTLPVSRGVLRLTSRVSGLGAALGPRVLAVAADAVQAVDLIDLADLDRPRQAGRIDGARLPLAVGDAVALVDADGQIHLHDIRDPDHPVDHGPLPLEGAPLTAAVAGPRAYCLTATTTGHRLHVIDIADPAEAEVIATTNLAAAGALAVSGRRLYVTGGNLVQIVDIAQPGPPTVVAWFTPTFAAANHLGLHEDLVICGPRLAVVRDTTWRPTAVITPALAPASRLVSVHPNPFNPRTTVTFDLDRPEHAVITVHDLRGRRLAVLADRPFAAGRHDLTWTAATTPLPSGVFLIHLHTPTRSCSIRATLLK